MDDFLATQHSKFMYIRIPHDIRDDVIELSHEGSENEFQNHLKRHFMQKQMSEVSKQSFQNSLSKKHENIKVDSQYITHSVKNGDYQIVTLVVPKVENQFHCITCYVDEYGVYKELPLNSRATRICNTDIRGDAFVSQSIDNSDLPYQRISFTKQDYIKLLDKPPPRVNLQNLDLNATPKEPSPTPATRKCLNCGALFQSSASSHSNSTSDATPSQTLPKPLQCSRCKWALYCSETCQKADWKYHRRVCAPPSTH